MRKQIRLPTVTPSMDVKLWRAAGRLCTETRCPVIPVILSLRGKSHRVLLVYEHDGELRAELYPRTLAKVDAAAHELLLRWAEGHAHALTHRSRCVSLGRKPRPAPPRPKAAAAVVASQALPAVRSKAKRPRSAV